MPRDDGGGGPAPVREPVEVALSAIASAAIAATVLLLLWPPAPVYWEQVAATIGELPTLAGVLAIAAGAGAWLARTSGFGLLALIVGTGAGTATVLLGIELWLAPDSPAHLVWYGALAGAIGCGALLWRIAVRVAG